jgi:hypothetical protein
LATGDSFSRLRLWRYPAAAAHPCSAEYRAHGGGGVGGLAFTCDGARLVSVGKEDGVVCQWRVDVSGGLPLDEACTEDVLVGAQTHDLRDTKVRRQTPLKPLMLLGHETPKVQRMKIDLKPYPSRLLRQDFARLPAAEAANVDDPTKLMFAEERAADDDFAPVQPWQRAAAAPSRPPPERLDEPLGSLRLEWMHGHRAGDVRQGVR